MATGGSLRAEERRSHLLATLRDAGRIEVEQAAALLDVSAMTVRRDLEDLEAEGLVRRVRGGAVPSLSPRPFGERKTEGAAAKALIADKARTLVPASGAVAMDASSTVGTLAARLPATDELVVTTNSHENFLTLTAGRGSGVSAILTGGELEESTGSLVGEVACRGAGAFAYDRFFCSAGAVDPAWGASEVSIREAEVKRVMSTHALETILCVDSSKLGRRSQALSVTFSEVDVLVTELEPLDARLDAYRDLVRLL